MNIFRFELRQGWKSALTWAISLSAISALYISIFPSISADQQAATDLIKNFPETFRKAFDISENYLTAFPSLYSVVLTIITLAGAVQAMNLGVGIISKEVRDKTADFLLTKPIGRFSVQAQKLLAAILLILLTDLIFFAAAWGLIQALITDPFPAATFLTCTAVLPLVQAFFLALGYLLGSVLPKVKSVIAVSLPTVFGFYVLGLFDSIIGEDKIKYVTPFKFFNINQLAAGGSYTTESLVYWGALIAVFIIGSFVWYRRRDIHTV